MRADLLALTPDAVAALANRGLVKRAQRELDRGDGPTLVEEPDGTVLGTFADGVVARLPVGVPLVEAPCSCGAPAACRHKVATALAYRPWAESRAPAEETTEADLGAEQAWSPAGFEDEALRAALGKRVFDGARRARSRGVVVELRHGPPPAAILPSCTVRFLVPRDLGYALCDCEVANHCVHLALAVWAFRESDRDRVVELRGEAHAGVDDGPLTPARALARELLETGVAGASPALGQRFAVAREALATARQAWPTLLLEDLEATLAAYRARSARYERAAAASLLVELEARARAASADAELPAGHVLGTGEALETRLDLLRLVSLGARVDGGPGWRRARVLLCDPSSAMVLVLERAWTFEARDDFPTGAGLASRSLGGGLRLGALAHGQVVSRAVRRRANRALVFGSRAGGATSVTPQTGAWEDLPEPIRVDGAAAVAAAHAARPPRLLRPRVLAEDVHVLPVAEVLAISWDPAAQTLTADVSDGEAIYHVVRAYRAAAPAALDAIAVALSGAHGPPRFVAGEVRRHLGRVEVDPSAIACDRVIVPDLWDGEAVVVPTAPSRGVEGHPEGAVATAAGLLEDAAHGGLRALSAGWSARLRESAAALDEVGLATTGEALATVASAVDEARVSGAGWPAACDAWLAAALRVALLREQL